MSETKGLFEKVAKTIELFFVIAGAAIAFFVYRDTKDQVLIAKAELSEARSQDSITNLQFLQQLQVSQIRDSLSNVSTQKSLDLSEKSFNISALALKNAELRSKRDQENFILIRKADVSLDSIMPSVENDTSVLIVLQFYNHGETQALDCKFSFATKVVDNLKNICDFDSSKLDIYPLGEEIPSHMTWVAPLKFN